MASYKVHNQRRSQRRAYNGVLCTQRNASLGRTTISNNRNHASAFNFDSEPAKAAKNKVSLLQKNDWVPFQVLAIIFLLCACFIKRPQKRSSLTRRDAASNVNGRACTFQNYFPCVFELLTDNTENSDEIKTDTTVHVLD